MQPAQGIAADTPQARSEAKGRGVAAESPVHAP